MKKHQKFTLLFFILSLLLYNPLWAQQDSTQVRKRPVVGLVLSGGGAKGFAYVGILKAIQKAGLRVDYIGGTSMGSIMGGLYAMGYDPDSIAKIIKTQNWDLLLRDKVPRKYIAFEEKGFTESSIANLPFKGKKIELQGALYQGQQINLLLNKYFSLGYRIKDFSKLPTPFFCMGTNVLNGKKVLLDSGYLPMAIRSSMSIPGYFSPTYYQGKYLVDGGVIDNYPAIQMKKMGATFIVGANVQKTPNQKIDNLNTVPKVLEQVISYYREPANRQGIAATNEYLHIKIPYDIMAFDKYDSIIAIGDRIAKDWYPRIKKLADSLNAIEYRPVRPKNARPLDSVTIAQVHYEGYKRVSLKFLENYFNRFKNTKVAIADIEKMVRMAYGTDYFTHVFYELQPAGDKTNLLIKVKEASPGSLGVAIHYDSDYAGSIILNMTLRNPLGKGSKLFAQTILGTDPRFRAIYLIDKGIHVGLGVKIDAYRFYFDSYHFDEKLTNYVFTNYSAAVFLNSNLKNLYNFKSGIEFNRFNFRQTYTTNSVALPNDQLNTFGNLFFSFNADTYDKAYFSTTGFQLSLNFKYIFDLTGSEQTPFFENVSIAYLNFSQNFRLAKKWNLNTGIFQGITLGQFEPPDQYYFYLGGQSQHNYMPNFVPFTGLRFIQETGKNLSIVKLRLRYNYLKNLYASVSLNTGLINDELKNYFIKPDLINGYGLTLSYESFIGPVQVSVMGSNRHSGAEVFFNLGYWF